MSDKCKDDVKFYAPSDTFGGDRPVPSCLPGEDRIPPEFTEPTPGIVTGAPQRIPGPVRLLSRAVVTACTELSPVQSPSFDTVYDFVDRHVRDEHGQIITRANKAYGKTITTAEGFYRDTLYLTDLTSEVSPSVLSFIADNKLEDVISFRLTAVSIMDSGELTANELSQMTRLSLEASYELLTKANNIRNRLTEEAKIVNLNAIECEWRNVYGVATCPEPEEDYIGNKYYAGTVVPGDKDYNPHSGLAAYRLYADLPQSSLPAVLQWLEGLGITEEASSIEQLVRDRLPQHVRNGSIPYTEVVRLSDPEETNRQFGVTGKYALFAKDSDLPPALRYADQDQIKEVVISYNVPADVVSSKTSQKDADAAAKALAESMLKCVYGNEPVTVECQDLPEYRGVIIEKVPNDKYPVMPGLKPRVGTYSIGKDVILSTTNTSIATTEATTMALGMLVCYYINQEVFLACYIAPEGEEPYDEDKQAMIRRRARNAGVIPNSDNWVKADPATGALGQEVYIPAGFFTSTTSAEEADEMARTLAQSLLECCYVNERIELECPDCIVKDVEGNKIPVKPVKDNTKNWKVVIEEGKFTSCESQDKANELARLEAEGMLECYYGNPEILPTCVPEWVLDSIATGALQLPLSQAIVGRNMALAYLDDGTHKVLVEDLPSTAMDGVAANTYVLKDDCQNAYEQAVRSKKTLRDAVKGASKEDVCVYLNDEVLYGCLVYDVYNEFGLRVDALHYPADMLQEYYTKRLDKNGKEIIDLEDAKINFMSWFKSSLCADSTSSDCCRDGCGYMSKGTCSIADTGKELSDSNLCAMWSGYTSGDNAIIGFSRVVILYQKADDGSFVELCRTNTGGGAWWTIGDVVTTDGKYTSEDPGEDYKYTNTKYKGPEPTEVGAEPMERWVFTDKVTGEVTIFYKRTVYYVVGINGDNWEHIQRHKSTGKPGDESYKWIQNVVHKGGSVYPEPYYSEYMASDKYDKYATDMDGVRLTLINPCGSPYVFPCLWPGYKKGYKSSGEAYFITTKFFNETTRGCYCCKEDTRFDDPQFDCATAPRKKHLDTFGGHDYQACTTRYRPIKAVIAQYPSSIAAGTIAMTATDIAAWEGVDAANLSLEEARNKVNAVAIAQADAIVAQLECNRKTKKIYAACDWKKQTFCCCPMHPSDHPNFKTEQTIWNGEVNSTTNDPVENYGLPNPIWYTGYDKKAHEVDLHNKCCTAKGKGGHAGHFSEDGNILKMGVSADCYTCDVFKETEKLVLEQLVCKFGNPEIRCSCQPVPVCYCEGQRWTLNKVTERCDTVIPPNVVWEDTSEAAAIKALEQGLSGLNGPGANGGCPSCPEDASKDEFCCGTQEFPPEVNDEYTATCSASVSASAQFYKKLEEGILWDDLTPQEQAEYDERILCEQEGQAIAMATASAEYTVPAGVFTHCLKSVANDRAREYAEQMVATMCNPEITLEKSDPQKVKCCEPDYDPTHRSICIGPEWLEIAAGQAEGLCKAAANKKALMLLSAMSSFCKKGYYNATVKVNCDYYVEEEIHGDINLSVVISGGGSVTIPEGVIISFVSYDDADNRAEELAKSLCINVKASAALFCNDEQCAHCDLDELEDIHDILQDVTMSEITGEPPAGAANWKRICIPPCTVTAPSKAQANSTARLLAENIASVACREKDPGGGGDDPDNPPDDPPVDPVVPAYGDCYCCKDTFTFESQLFTVVATPKQNQDGERGDCVEYHVKPDIDKIKEIIEENIGEIHYEWNPSQLLEKNDNGELYYTTATIEGVLGDKKYNDALVHY